MSDTAQARWQRYLALARVLVLVMVMVSWSFSVAAGAVLAVQIKPKPKPEPAPALDAAEESVRSAIEQRRQALAAAAERPPAEQAQRWGDLGLSYHAHELRAAALICYQNAQALEPEEPAWPHLIGVLRFEEGKFSLAAESFAAALQQAPASVATLLRLGEARRRALDVAGARVAFEAALELDPSAAAARCGLGALAAATGEDGVAVEHYRACLGLQPGATRVHAQLTALYRRLGEVERAAEHARAFGPVEVAIEDPYLDRLRSAVAYRDVHLERGGEAARAGRFETAMREYELALRTTPDDPRPHRALGNLHEQRGDLATAVAHYRRALELDADDVLSHFNLGALLAQEGELPGAMVQFEAVVRLDPTDGDAAAKLGWLYEQVGELEKAAELYGRWLAEGRADPGLMRRSASTYWRLGRIEDAANVLASVAELDPTDGSTKVLLGGLRLELGRLEEAKVALESALASSLESSQAAQAHYLLGVVAQRQGHVVEAERRLRDSLRLAPEYFAPRGQLIELLAQDSRCDEAREVLAGGLPGEGVEQESARRNAAVRLEAVCPGS